MNEETASYRLRKVGDVHVLRPKVIWVQVMMFVTGPLMMAFVAFGLYSGSDRFTSAQVAGSVLMLVMLASVLVVFVLGCSSILVKRDEIAFRLGIVWRCRALGGVRTCHTKPVPKGLYSIVELELEDGTRRNLTRLPNAAADRLADLICEVTGVQTPADAGREAIASTSIADIPAALCTTDEYLASQPTGARNPLIAIHALLERRWAGKNSAPLPAMAVLDAQLTALGFRRIGSTVLLWTPVPIPIQSTTYVNEDGSVLAELVHSQGEHYHFLSHTTTPKVRWSWSKVEPTTKSSAFVESVGSTGSMELDYAAHRAWLAEQANHGAKIATVHDMNDHLALAALRARRFVSDATVAHLLVTPLALVIPLVVVLYLEFVK